MNEITTAIRRAFTAAVMHLAATLEAFDQALDEPELLHEPNDPRAMCRHHDQQVAEPRAWGFHEG